MGRKEAFELQLAMHAVGVECLVLQKTLDHAVEMYELAILQGKDPSVIDDHYLRSSVAFEQVLDKKRELAELSRKWAVVAQSRGQS